jgi:hypothetical protein
MKTMSLDQELINELDEILKKDYGRKLSQRELFEVANTLLLYFELLVKIYWRDKLKKESKLNLTLPKIHYKMSLS